MVPKRLVPGSMVLGQVIEINKYDVALSLPNNLTGYVPLTSISDKVTKQLEELAAKDDDEADESIVDTGIDPKRLFSLGQYLRAYVTSTHKQEASGARGKRHIELSVKPREANAGLSKSDYVLNSMVQASVISVEDHGLIMDLEMVDHDARGFMSSKELASGIDISNVEEGAVLLCLVTGRSSNGKTIKLSSDPQKIGNVKKGNYLADAPSVDSFLPGTAVEILISEVMQTGIAGKVMGLLDVTADFIHSGAASSGKSLEAKYTVGSKIKGRIICTFPTVEEKKLGISIQDHVLYWKSKSGTNTSITTESSPTDLLPISSIIEEIRISKIEQGVGLLVDVGVKGVRGFVHISKISDGKIETLTESTGKYKLGSVHKARVIGYNPMDGLFIVSMEAKIIDQPFLRIEDVKIGQVVKGVVEKIIIGGDGVSGLVVKIAEGITGYVPEIHLADIHLQNPEKRFKEGSPVTARVLSTDHFKRQIRLTLKKSLVNSDIEPWTSYHDLKPGLEAPGTLRNVLPSGAIVQFYGSVQGFLPVSEMSESYIKDPKVHFRRGQVVKVHVVSIDPTEGRMLVSCKDPSIFGAAQQEALKNIRIGDLVTGTVIEKNNDEIVVSLEPSGLKASLPIAHLSDESKRDSESLAKRIRIDQQIKDLLVLDKQETKRLIKLTSKRSILKAARMDNLIKSFEDVVEGLEVKGFVQNITATGVFVQFAGDLTGLLLKQHIPDEASSLPDFGLRKNQSISPTVLSVDHGQRRFLLTLKSLQEVQKGRDKTAQSRESHDRGLSNPIDGISTSLDDFTVGKLTMAKVVSIKETQMNVELADAIQGRIDVSEIFDEWEKIENPKHPLKVYHENQILPVRILGMHDSRNHRFLPITHRGKAPVFELTAKPNSLKKQDMDILTMAKVQVGSSWLVYINNVGDDHLWVNISPNVRGRIRVTDVSDDVSQLEDLAKNFPVGSALKAKVQKVDVEHNHLDLSARSGGPSSPSNLQDLSEGMILPGRITKVTERQIMIQLSDSLSAPIHLVDLADDYSKANPTTYYKNQIIRVCVKNIDVTNKKIILSARPSKVLSSTLPIRDPDLISISQLKVNDIRRGFIKNVADNGIFISLASNVTAFVRISDLSDAFLKDWKSGFEVDQLVEGKVVFIDEAVNHLRMSLKKSHLDNDYRPLLEYSDIQVGQTITGKIRKVMDFGVFVVIDDSTNVSGLCHRTKMSDQLGANPRKLYEEGDAVQAKVLAIDQNKKRISLGLKASYFGTKSQRQSASDLTNTEDNDQDVNGDMSMDDANGVELDELGSDDGVEKSVSEENSTSDIDGENEVEADGVVNGGVAITQFDDDAAAISKEVQILAPGGFDWMGGGSAPNEHEGQSETDAESVQPRKKKRRKAVIQEDRTGDLDTHGPQSVADFERLLLPRPNSSNLWVQYMAFYLGLGENDKAREVAERALKTINMGEEAEKLNVWVAMMNLENTYGDSDMLEEVFKRACQYNDSQRVHEHLISIYITSGHHTKADDLFQAALKKHSQIPDIYYNNATFLMSTLACPDRARALLPRAMQSLPPHTHLALTSKFAQLEFTSPNGDPERGRTVFETLLAQWPKRLDLWNVWLDLEIKQGDQLIIRRLFERVTGSDSKLKPRKAKFFFKKWLDYEEKSGNSKTQARVKALATEYVKAHGKAVEAE